MAKKYLITLQDESVQQLENYLQWQRKVIMENLGVEIKPTATGTLTEIITGFLANLKYNE